jgi:hypothetical protein
LLDAIGLRAILVSARLCIVALTALLCLRSKPAEAPDGAGAP